MNKPQDFDSVQGFNDWVALPAGGYVCRIMQVEETVSKAGNAMITISLDIAEGEFAKYFENSYKNDKRPDKKWGCTAYQLVYDLENSNSTNKGFKTFTTAVCDSNSGFTIPWGNNFGNGFKNKLVGVIFRREQYWGDDNQKHFKAKPYSFRGVETIRSGKFKTPEDKLLNDSQPTGYAPQNQPQKPYVDADLSDFEEVISNDELPF